MPAATETAIVLPAVGTESKHAQLWDCVCEYYKMEVSIS